MSFFKGWDDAPRGPAVHHKEDLTLASETRANGVVVWYGRDGDYLHIIAFNGTGLGTTLAPGAPVSALVEKIRDGETMHDAAERLAKRASRYAVKRNPNIYRPLNIPSRGI
jgi:hypothetical protein